MISWFPLAFWFILHAIFGGVILVLGIIMTEARMTEYIMNVFVIIMISLFLLSIVSLSFGFRAPNKLVNITINDIVEEKIQTVVKNAIEAHVKEVFQTSTSMN